jgi:hypothetical protein
MSNLYIDTWLVLQHRQEGSKLVVMCNSLLNINFVFFQVLV